MSHDRDRLTILARRRRLALLALGGLTTGCHVEPRTETPDPRELELASAPATAPEPTPEPAPLDEAQRRARAEEASALEARAEEAHARGDHTGALALYREANLLAPEHTEVIRALALEALEVDDCDTAYLALWTYLAQYDGSDEAPVREALHLLEQMENDACVDPALLPKPCLSVSAPGSR